MKWSSVDKPTMEADWAELDLELVSSYSKPGLPGPGSPTRAMPLNAYL